MQSGAPILLHFGKYYIILSVAFNLNEAVMDIILQNVYI